MNSSASGKYTLYHSFSFDGFLWFFVWCLIMSCALSARRGASLHLNQVLEAKHSFQPAAVLFSFCWLYSVMHFVKSLLKLLDADDLFVHCIIHNHSRGEDRQRLKCMLRMCHFNSSPLYDCERNGDILGRKKLCSNQLDWTKICKLCFIDLSVVVGKQHLCFGSQCFTKWPFCHVCLISS